MRTLLAVCLMVLCGCADSCGCEPSASESPFPSSAPTGQSPSAPTPHTTTGTGKQPPIDQMLAEAALEQGIGSSVVEWQALSPYAPDTVAGFTANAAAEGKTIPLPKGMQVTTLKRKYSQGDSELEIEMIDTAQTPSVRQVFSRASQMTHESPESVTRVAEVQGRKALLQWNKATGTARVSILVGDRFMVNSNVKPASSPDAAIAVAQKLDLSGLEKLNPH